MGFTTTIHLNEETYKIWKEMFGNYSQGFSKWIGEMLNKEFYKMKNMDLIEQKAIIKTKQKEIAFQKKIYKEKLIENQVKITEKEEKDAIISIKREENIKIFISLIEEKQNEDMKMYDSITELDTNKYASFLYETIEEEVTPEEHIEGIISRGNWGIINYD